MYIKERGIQIIKENFIEILSNMTPEKINIFLKEKGTERKLICPVWRVDKEEIQNKKEKENK